jgi:hypothetical protein
MAKLINLDLCAVASDSGALSLLDFSTTPNAKPNIVFFGKTTCRRLTPGQYIAADWLEENGQCMDNIKVGQSKNPNAGRGAFANRFIPKGGLVAPAPLIHIPDSEVLKMYREVTDNNRKGQVNPGIDGPSTTPNAKPNIVFSDNSEHEDADADSDGTSKEDEDGTEDLDTSDDNDEDDAENHQAERGPSAVLAKQTKDKVDTQTARYVFQPARPHFRISKLDNDGAVDGVTSDDDGGNAAETADEQADHNPGKVPAEQTKEMIETEGVDASAEVDSDDSEHEDAEADSDGASKEDEDGTDDVDTSDDNDEDEENHQADRGPGAVLAEQTKDQLETQAARFVFQPAKTYFRISTLDNDEAEDSDMSDDDGVDAVETSVEQADRDPGKLPAELAEQTIDKVETETVDVSPVVDTKDADDSNESEDSKHEDADTDSDDSENEDADAHSDGAPKENEDGTEEADLSDADAVDAAESADEQAESDPAKVLAEQAMDKVEPKAVDASSAVNTKDGDDSDGSENEDVDTDSDDASSQDKDGTVSGDLSDDAGVDAVETTDEQAEPDPAKVLAEQTIDTVDAAESTDEQAESDPAKVLEEQTMDTVEPKVVVASSAVDTKDSNNSEDSENEDVETDSDDASSQDEDEDGTANGDLSDDDGIDDVETTDEQAEPDPAKVLAEQTLDKAETETAEVSSVVNTKDADDSDESEDSKLEDADTDSNVVLQRSAVAALTGASSGIPVRNGSNGGLILPNREEDDLSSGSQKTLSSSSRKDQVSIYKLDDKASTHPTLVSAYREEGYPIPFLALSALSAKGEDMLYCVDNSFYSKSQVFAINTTKCPSMIVDGTRVLDLNDILLGALDEAVSTILLNEVKIVNLDQKGFQVIDGGFWIVSEGSGTVGISKTDDKGNECQKSVEANIGGAITTRAADGSFLSESNDG